MCALLRLRMCRRGRAYPGLLLRVHVRVRACWLHWLQCAGDTYKAEPTHACWAVLLENWKGGVLDGLGGWLCRRAMYHHHSHTTCMHACAMPGDDRDPILHFVECAARAAKAQRGVCGGRLRPPPPTCSGPPTQHTHALPDLRARHTRQCRCRRPRTPHLPNPPTCPHAC